MRAVRVGIDSVEIGRLKESVERGSDRFLRRVYSEEEIQMLCQKGMKAESLAANFAVKEAFSKAIGTGVVGFRLNEVSTLRDELGAPYIKLSGAALELVGDYNFTVSITHTETTATAIVIAYKE